MPAKMSKIKHNTCEFCHTSEKFYILGELIKVRDIYVHLNCMYTASNLVQNPKKFNAVRAAKNDYGFDYQDILKELKRCRRLTCIYCRQKGACIGCCVTRCRKKFHFMCVVKSRGSFDFSGSFEARCFLHSNRQVLKRLDMFQYFEEELFKLKEPPSCSICRSTLFEFSENVNIMGDVSLFPRQDCSGIKTRFNYPSWLKRILIGTGKKNWSIDTRYFNWKSLVQFAGCCSNSWFHKECIQGYAYSAGAHHLKCPVCSNHDKFARMCSNFGIWVPDRDALWELDPNAFEDQVTRESERNRDINFIVISDDDTGDNDSNPVPEISNICRKPSRRTRRSTSRLCSKTITKLNYKSRRSLF